MSWYGGNNDGNNNNPGGGPADPAEWDVNTSAGSTVSVADGETESVWRSTSNSTSNYVVANSAYDIGAELEFARVANDTNLPMVIAFDDAAEIADGDAEVSPTLNVYPGEAVRLRKVTATQWALTAHAVSETASALRLALRGWGRTNSAVDPILWGESGGLETAGIRDELSRNLGFRRVPPSDSFILRFGYLLQPGSTDQGVVQLYNDVGNVSRLTFDWADGTAAPTGSSFPELIRTINDGVAVWHWVKFDLTNAQNLIISAGNLAAGSGGLLELIDLEVSASRPMIPLPLPAGQNVLPLVASFQWMLSEIPAEGLYEMNGQTIAGGVAKYPVLAARAPQFVSGANIVLPDWRGRFIGHEGGLDLLDGVGNLYVDKTAVNGLAGTSLDRYAPNFTNKGTGGNVARQGSTTVSRSVTLTGDAETRPNAVGLVLCVVADAQPDAFSFEFTSSNPGKAADDIYRTFVPRETRDYTFELEALDMRNGSMGMTITEGLGAATPLYVTLTNADRLTATGQTLQATVPMVAGQRYVLNGWTGGGTLTALGSITEVG